MDRNTNRNRNENSDFERGDHRRMRDDRGTYLDDEEGYGRRAMDGRDYSTTGQYFEEDPRGRVYGDISRFPDEVRLYNVVGYGGARVQSDFYSNARDLEESHMASDFYSASGRTQPEGEGGEYGFAPSDDYQLDRDQPGDRERGQRGRQWNRSEPGRGEGRGYQGATNYRDRSEDRFIDRDYTEEYRRGQRWAGSSPSVWGDFAPAEGPYVGRGPKGYVRSVDRIKEEVCERLTLHGRLDASEIEVKIEDSEVTLSGTVDSRTAKRLAEEIVESVSGVRDIHNHLRISQTGSDRSEQHTDEQENTRTSAPRGNKRTSHQT